ncbi:MAG: CBS domain-containing protein, partial [Cyanobacteria bacterium J06638_6]
MTGLSNSNFLETRDSASAIGFTRSTTMAGNGTACLGDLVDGRPAVLSPQMSIRSAAEVMRDQPLSCVVVVEGGTILGLFTEQEVLDAVAAGLDLGATPIGLGRVPQVPILQPCAPLDTALEVMQAADQRYLLVVDERGRICGLVPRQRLYRALVDGGLECSLRAAAALGPGAAPDGWAEPGMALDMIGAKGETVITEQAGLSDSDRDLTVLTNIHYQLLGQQGQNRLRVLNRCLMLLGRASESVGAALFEIHLDGSGSTLTSLRAAWHRSGQSAIDQGKWQNLPLSQLQRWHDVLARGGTLKGAIATFPASEQVLLNDLG